MGEQLCPVCQGHRIVPHGFYNYPAGQSFMSTDASPEQCRRCGGLGTITVSDPPPRYEQEVGESVTHGEWQRCCTGIGVPCKQEVANEPDEARDWEESQTTDPNDA